MWTHCPPDTVCHAGYTVRAAQRAEEDGDAETRHDDPSPSATWLAWRGADAHHPCTSRLRDPRPITQGKGAPRLS